MSGKVCGQCEAKDATLFCEQCEENYCADCSKKFHSKGKLQNHQVTPIAQSAKKDHHMCSHHPGQKLVMYCITDNQVVCPQCLLKGGNHHDHRYEPLNQTYEGVKLRLRLNIENVKLASAKTHERVKGVMTSLDEIDTQLDLSNAMIDEKFDEIDKALKQKKDALKAIVSQAALEKISPYKNYKTELFARMSIMEEQYRMAESFLERNDPYANLSSLMSLDASLEKLSIFTDDSSIRPTPELFYTLDTSFVLQAIPRLEVKRAAPDTFFKRKIMVLSQNLTSMYASTPAPAQTPKPAIGQGASQRQLPVVSESGEMSISGPISGSFRHEGHMGFNKDTGQFEVRGLPNEWNSLLSNINSTVQKQGQQSLTHEEVTYLVEVLKEVDTNDEISEKAEVLYDYDAADEGELSLKVGFIVTVLDKDDSGWWFGRYDKQEGFFPGSYVTLLKQKVEESPPANTTVKAQPSASTSTQPAAADSKAQKDQPKTSTATNATPGPKVGSATPTTTSTPSTVPSLVSSQSGSILPPPPPVFTLTASSLTSTPARAPLGASNPAGSPTSAPSIPAPIGASTRNELLDSIRQGPKLRASVQQEKKEYGVNRTEEQLMKALMRFRGNSNSDDED